MAQTIEDARRRTRVVGQKLRGVETLAPDDATALLAMPSTDPLDLPEHPARDSMAAW
jgi:hypothetical protein